VKLTAVLALVLGICIAAWPKDKASPKCWPWPDSMEATVAAPGNHRILYDDANIRLLEVTAFVGEMGPFHDHPWSSIFINLQPQPRGRDHEPNGSVTDPGGEILANANFPVLSATGPQGPHSWEDLDRFPKRFYSLEFKKIPFVCPARVDGHVQEPAARKTAITTVSDSMKILEGLTTVDEAITSPKTDTILLDRPDIRLIEVTIAPGQTETMGMDAWPSALMFYQPQPRGTDTFAKSHVTQVGRRFEGALFPTAIRMGPQPAHSFRNTDTFPAHFYRVEFKKIQFKG
jgi:hypothetical protein